MSKKQFVYDHLKKNNVDYILYEHPAVFTVEEVNALELPYLKDLVKNLFLRDDKGREHYLVVIQKDKQVNLAELREQLSSRKLGFASEERLMKFLNLEKGSVTPFGLLYESAKSVKAVFDRDLIGGKIGIHPNENDATILLDFDDLINLLQKQGIETIFVDIKS